VAKVVPDEDSSEHIIEIVNNTQRARGALVTILGSFSDA